MHYYTEEEKEFFKEYVPGHSHKEIQEEFIKRFGWEISVMQVKSSIKRYRLNTGRTGHWEKGQKAWNKGKPMSKEQYKKCAPTMFKKGQIPKQYRPVGSERINVDGYIEIKVSDPKKWKLKHRVVWEHHNGEIPKGNMIVFLDGNKLNCDISNLKMISNAELLVMNKNGLFTGNADLTEIGLNVARIINKTQERGKERGG